MTTQQTGDTGTGTDPGTGSGTGTSTDTGSTGSTGGTGTGTGTSQQTDTGFPADTPVAEMTAVQQAAYHKHQSRKHEGRAQEWQNIAGGRTAAQIAADLAELTALKAEKMSDSEKAIAAAKAEAAKEYGPKAARAVFQLALSHVEDASERTEILEAIDLSSVVNENGDIDTAKVSRIVARLAPATSSGEKRIRDFGAGSRESSQASGVSAGRQLFAERNKKSTTQTTNSS